MVSAGEKQTVCASLPATATAGPHLVLITPGFGANYS